MRLRYVAKYAGISGITQRHYKPGEIYDEPNDVAAQLLASGQFEKVVEKKATAEVSNIG